MPAIIGCCNATPCCSSPLRQEQLLLQLRVLHHRCRSLLLLQVRSQTLSSNVLLDRRTDEALWVDALPVVLEQLPGRHAPAHGMPSFCVVMS